MTNRNRIRLIRAISLIIAAILINGCAAGGVVTLDETGGQTLPQAVTTEYLLSTAGFQLLPVNDETPKRQALYNNIPPGKLVWYSRNGEVYHAYVDFRTRTLYVGDEAAYQRYLSLARGRQVCERVPGTSHVAFWGCMQEYQERGPGR